jgi:hypothetical protein
MNLRQNLMASALAAGLATAASQASAMEDGWVALPNATVGTPTGALPPVGLYSTTGFQYYNISSKNGDGNSYGVHHSQLDAAQQFLFVPDVPTIFGARYGAFVVFPVRSRTTHISAGLPNAGTWSYIGNINTVISPVNLSWKLSNDFYVSAGYTYYADNGAWRPNDKVKVARGFDSHEAHFGLSWLPPDWVATANIAIVGSNKNTSSNYQSGWTVGVDYTLLRKIANFELGFGGALDSQLSDDYKNGVIVPATPGYSMGRRGFLFDIGPVARYKFNGVTFSASMFFDAVAVNATGGTRVFLSVSAPLWKPEPAPAVVAAKF